MRRHDDDVAECEASTGESFRRALLVLEAFRPSLGVQIKPRAPFVDPEVVIAHTEAQVALRQRIVEKFRATHGFTPHFPGAE